MKNLFFICFLVLLTAHSSRAQELSLATASLFELKTMDFSKLPTSKIYYKHRVRRPGTIGMIVGASAIVIGGTIIAATSNPKNNNSEGMPDAYYGFVIAMPGLITAGISGMVYVVCRLAHVTWTGGMQYIATTTNSVLLVIYNGPFIPFNFLP
jgi:hypothetical protein